MAGQSLFSNRGNRGAVMVNMPAEIVYRAEPSDWQITRKQNETDVVFEWFDLGQSVKLQIADSFALRDAFFAVKNPDDAEEFLKRCGPFRADMFSVSWTSFVAWKAYFTRQRLTAKNWGSLPERCSDASRFRIIGEPSLRTWPLPRAGGKEQVTLLLECDSALEAIAAANYLDRRAGVVNKTCPCGAVFEPPTKRRTTCSDACTHRFGQRRRRGSKKEN